MCCSPQTGKGYTYHICASWASFYQGANEDDPTYCFKGDFPGRQCWSGPVQFKEGCGVPNQPDCDEDPTQPECGEPCTGPNCDPAGCTPSTGAGCSPNCNQQTGEGCGPTTTFCLSGWTLIDTPAGPIAVEDLRVGDAVWSLGSDGLHFALARYIVNKPIRYVKWDAGGTNNGTSWTNAYTDLQTAISAASGGDEIWVAAGMYKPTTGVDRSATFQLKTGVAIYGGFAGAESSRADRNPILNITTLSGDLDGDDVGFANNSENVYHVVTGTTGATLDGFTITAGNADGAYWPNNLGGGMFNLNGSSPVLMNITFIGNSAAGTGGSPGGSPAAAGVAGADPY